ncbi:MAG TPA: choice-of-anchor tandem repeat GloVer-containing protein [Bacteroidia bacterium]|nr:choice-of-anchor tandem repeat GloVer-containing protein [Bacteroidia bacterium]
MKSKFYQFTLAKKICIFFAGAIILVSSLHAQPYIYGATNAGGVNGLGELFKIDESASPTENMIYSNDVVSGYNIQGTLLFASDNNIYGMTHLGGIGGADSGVIFQYNPGTATYTDLLNLNANTGGYATGKLIEGNSGTFYGMTASGGVHDSGVIFKYKKSTNVLTVLYSFKKSSGCKPLGSLTLHNSLLYGMTSIGGAQDSGVIFSFDTASLTYTILASLNKTTGAKPQGTLYLNSAGNLFGLTATGGTKNGGTIVEYNTTTSTITDYHDFALPTGAVPDGDVIMAGNKLYGMTSIGGAHDSGVIFMVNTATSTYTDLFDFTKSQGAKPMGSLLLASNSYLYGMTRIGGAHNFGVIFRMDTVSHAYTKLIDFAGVPSSGQNPMYTQLMEVCIPATITKQPANAKICEGSDTSFTAAGTATSTVTYQWQVNSGAGYSNLSDAGVYSGSATSTLILTGATAGMNAYTYRCVLKDGCIDSSTTNMATLTVNALPVVTITSNPISDSVCPGGSITLSGNGAKTYVWTGSITNGVAFTPATGGKYVVTGTDVNGCINKDSVNIGIKTAPTVSFTSTPANDTVCKGGSVTLNGTGALSYSWNNGVTDGVAFNPPSSGMYIVTGTGSNGCTNSDTANIVVDNIKATITGDVIGGLNICGAGNMDTLMANTTGGIGPITYSWSTGGSNDTAMVSSANSYSVTVTDVHGCSANTNATVNIHSIPTVTVTSSPASDTVCAGGSVTLKAGGSGGTTYSWSGGITDGSAFTPLSSGQYIVIGTRTSSGCQNKDTIQVVVNPLPVITVIANSDTILAGTMDTLTANGNSVSYVWTTGGTNDTAVVAPSVTTTYTVTGTGANGCTDTMSIRIVVSVITGINNVGDKNSTTLYPNPANETMYIMVSMQTSFAPVVIRVIDVMGKELISVNGTLTNGKPMPVDVSGLAAGVYFVKVTTARSSRVVRFVKE